MATYVNPVGSPLVMFPGPVSFTQDEIAAACRARGPLLRLDACPDVDGVKLLWALAGNESSFGHNCKPRHENAFCVGRYSQQLVVTSLYKRYAHAAHCSFGPWQVMLVNIGVNADLSVFDTAMDAALVAVNFVNEVILGRQGATTLDQIFDAYNSGNFRDANVPTEYIAKGHANYLVPMPAVRVMPK